MELTNDKHSDEASSKNNNKKDNSTENKDDKTKENLIDNTKIDITNIDDGFFKNDENSLKKKQSD